MVDEGETIQLTVTASGVNMGNFSYKWSRRGDHLQSRVRRVNRATLTIRNILLSDEGQYYCTVTNEWGNSVSTGNITLTVKGVCMHTINARCT